MGEENLCKSVDKTMSELREKLRQANEKLSTASRSLGEKSPACHHKETPPQGLTSNIHSPSEPRQTNPQNIEDDIPAESWPAHLQAMSTRLESATCGSEAEFLRLGAMLHDFRARAVKVSEMSEYTARLINDSEVEKLVVELSWILDMLREWLEGLPSDDAHAVRRLRTEKIVERTESCLGALKKKHYISAAMAKSFTQKSENVTRYIFEVVKSMQFHDITRQRIEHVKTGIETLARLLDDAAASSPERDGHMPGDAAVEAGRACDELSRSLIAADADFGRAFKSITDNLQLVAQNAAGISSDIRSTARGENDSEKSFMSGMGNWLSALSDTLGGFPVEDRSMAVISMGSSPLSESEIPAGWLNPAGVGLGRSDADFTQLLDMLNGMIKSMHRINGNILYHLSLVEDAGLGLSEDVGEAIGAFGAHMNVSKVAQDVAAGLGQIARISKTIPSWPKTGSSPAIRGRMDEFRISCTTAKAEQDVEIF